MVKGLQPLTEAMAQKNYGNAAEIKIGFKNPLEAELLNMLTQVLAQDPEIKKTIDSQKVLESAGIPVQTKSLPSKTSRLRQLLKLTSPDGSAFILGGPSQARSIG